LGGREEEFAAQFLEKIINWKLGDKVMLKKGYVDPNKLLEYEKDYGTILGTTTAVSTTTTIITTTTTTILVATATTAATSLRTITTTITTIALVPADYSNKLLYVVDVKGKIAN